MEVTEESKFLDSGYAEDSKTLNTRLEVKINQVPLLSSQRMLPYKHRPVTKWRVLKNLYVMSFSLFVFFLGFFALSNLQSTLNSKNGVGVQSQAVIYAVSLLSCLLLPELFVKSIGCKKTLVLSVLVGVPYIAANFYPSAGTLIPSAVLLGLSAGPLTASRAIYTNEMARSYHEVSPEEFHDVVVAKFFGIYYFFVSNTQIWGNLISYYALRPSTSLTVNNTYVEKYCGVHFNPQGLNNTFAANPNLEPPEKQRFLLIGIYTLCGILSVLMLQFLMDPMEGDIEKDCESKTQCQSIMSRMIAATKHSTKSDQILLVPLSIYCGIQMSFYCSEFTRAYIACSWGVYHVGFVSICFGVFGALMSLSVGPLVKCISQMAVILLGAVLTLMMCILLFYWKPSPEAPADYFVFAGVWGITDSIWWSQVAALYGLMFPNDREAAFSNFFFWSFLGFFMSYSYANYLSVAVKIHIMLTFLVVGTILYLIGQMKIKYFSPRMGYSAI